MFNQRYGPLESTPTVVKNLVIINALFFLVKFLGNGMFLGQDMDGLLGLHYLTSPEFRPWQLVTHMFMHGDIWHLFFNMFGLFMLGAPLEYRWGSQRFLTYYMICGLGAALIYLGVQALDYAQVVAQLSPEQVEMVRREGQQYVFNDSAMNHLAGLYFIDLVGASGAIFGVLVAFGMLYPNVELMIFPLPIPIKAKYFVMLYGAYELYSGLVRHPGDNVAHFAHIGGLVVGFITVMTWRKRLPYT
ncbi:MAG: rhomboid family intramembrane serine protease [Flavobacteriales bacterium]|nr:rhomboid family intramembrane serine protease [Flavobacteriales bacterium]